MTPVTVEIQGESHMGEWAIYEVEKDYISHMKREC